MEEAAGQARTTRRIRVADSRHRHADRVGLCDVESCQPAISAAMAHRTPSDYTPETRLTHAYAFRGISYMPNSGARQLKMMLYLMKRTRDRRPRQGCRWHQPTY